MSNGLVGSGASGIADLIAGMACQGHRIPEFGSIQVRGAGLGLVPDSMPTLLIPSNDDSPGGFMQLTELRAASSTTTATVVSTFGGHTHTTPSVGLAAGDRVLIVWCQDTPVVLGKV